MRHLALGLLFLFVFLVPFENMLLLDGLGTAARLTGFLAFLFGLVAVLEMRRLHLEAVHAWAGVFVATALASLFWTIEPERTAARAATYLQLLGAAWLIGQLLKEEREIRLLLAAYVLGAWVAVGGTFYSFSRGIEVFYARFAATGFNPNDLAYILALGIPLAWYLRSRAAPFVRSLYTAYPVAAVAGVLLTASRGGVFAAAIGLAFVAFTTRPARLVAGAGSVALAALAVAELVPLPHEGLARLGTIGDELFYGTLNQRTLIWTAGLAVYLGVPAVGVGAGAFSSAVVPHLGTELAPHNALLSVLVEQGAIGFVALLVLLGLIVQRVSTLPVPERRLWLFVGSVLAVALSLANWEWRKQTWILIALATTHVSTLRRVTATSTDDMASPDDAMRPAGVGASE